MSLHIWLYKISVSVFSRGQSWQEHTGDRWVQVEKTKFSIDFAVVYCPRFLNFVSILSKLLKLFSIALNLFSRILLFTNFRYLKIK